MLEQKFLDRFDMERRIQSRLYCFGSGSSDSDSSESDVSDEDLDEDLQQDIAAAAVQQSGTNIGSYSFSPNFDQDDKDNQTLINATSDILTAAATAPPGQMQQAVDTGTAFAAQRPGVADAIVNAAMTPLPPAPNASYFGELAVVPASFENLGNVATVSAPLEITGLGGEVFDTTSGEIIQPFAGDQDDTDPFTGTGRTAMDVLNYDTDDQSAPAGQIRPFGGLTRAQQANLEGRDDFVARNILAAQTPQPSGFPTTNLTGIYTVGNDPMGNVRGFTDFGPELPFIGPTQVYTGFGDNPFAPPDTSTDETVPPVTNPLTGRDQCPDGYVFDEDLQACRRKTKRELQADNGTGGGSSRPAGDMFFRRTSLDDAPANLPSGFDFDAANRAFTQSFAVRPSFFQRPPDLTGYTLL